MHASATKHSWQHLCVKQDICVYIRKFLKAHRKDSKIVFHSKTCKRSHENHHLSIWQLPVTPYPNPSWIFPPYLFNSSFTEPFKLLPVVCLFHLHSKPSWATPIYFFFFNRRYHFFLQNLLCIWQSSLDRGLSIAELH